MDNLNNTTLEINKLRNEINHMIVEGFDLKCNDILVMSNNLDILINQWYKEYNHQEQQLCHECR